MQISDPILMGPILSLQEIGTQLVADIEPGPSDLIPGLLPRGGQLLIVGETEVGKANPLDANILTPQGWKLMGDIQIGDTLTNPLGGTTKVVGVYPQGKIQVYRVTFSDGRSAEACAKHLWEVHHPNWARHGGSGFKLKTTEELTMFTVAESTRACIKPPESVEFETKSSLSIDPWLLGVLIGDGSLTSGVSFSSADQEIIDKVQSKLTDNLKLNKVRGQYDYSITAIKGGKNTLLHALRYLDLIGKRAWEKSIPDIYMHASIENRRALISGLIDTDGYVAKNGCLQFTSTSEKLISQVAYIIRSLGGTCKIKSKMGGYRKNGKKTWTRIAYTATISCPDSQSLVTLSRKQDRLGGLKQHSALKVVSVEPTRITEAQCIMVDDPRGLYITDNFVVTHNTTVSLEIVSSLVTGNPLWKDEALAPTEVIDKVVYLLGEHYNEIVQRLWRKMGIPMSSNVWLLGPEQLGSDKYLVSQARPNMVAIEKLKKWCDGAGLVVFDPLGAFIAGADAENDNNLMRMVLDQMSLVTQAVGSACLVLAHQGKPQMEKGREYSRSKYATRGASAIEDAATNIFYMNHKEDRDFELVKRKYKGESRDKFRLLRDRETLTHTHLK